MTDSKMTTKITTNKITELNVNSESFVSDFLMKEQFFFDKLEAKFIKNNSYFFE